MHLDVIVADLDAAEAAVLELGATRHEHQPRTSFRVFLDPAGPPSVSAWTDSGGRCSADPIPIGTDALVLSGV